MWSTLQMGSTNNCRGHRCIGVVLNYCDVEEIGIICNINDNTFKVDEIRTSAEEGTLEEAALTEVDQVESSEVEVGLLGEEGQEGSGAEGELVGDNEVELDQQSGVEDLNTHHGIFPIIEVSSGKKQ